MSLPSVLGVAVAGVDTAGVLAAGELAIAEGGVPGNEDAGVAGLLGVGGAAFIPASRS